MSVHSLFRHLQQVTVERVRRHGAPYRLYGWFGLLNAPLYYLIWHYATPESYENGWLRLFSAMLCLLLILHRYWPKKWQPWLPLYWYTTLFLTLPFFFTFMLIMNEGSALWVANNIVIVFFILLLVDYLSAIILLVSGSVLGTGVALMLLSSAPVDVITTLFHYRGFLITYVIAMIIGTLFSHNRERIEALMRRTIRLEAECQEKSHFIANLSHDLRTPLSGLLSLSELESQRLPAQHPLKETLFIVHQSAQQLHQLFENLLETAKLNHTAKQTKREPFCIETIINQVLQLFQPALKSKGLAHEIIAEKSAVYQPLEGYSLLIERTLINLVSNAIKFTDHGKITIAYRVDSLRHGNAELIIKIRDTGRGIAQSDQAHIFKSFRQVIPAYQQPYYSGIGLGLHNAKKMVEIMGGKLEVSSEGEGCGSTFICTLPVKRIETAIAPNDSG